jgi:hypothetical protein
MDRWLNKSRNTSSSDANENICITPTNSASLKRANSPPNKQSDTATSDTTVSKRRKYDENYISFGFIHENSYPQCVVCTTYYVVKFFRIVQWCQPNCAVIWKLTIQT